MQRAADEVRNQPLEDQPQVIAHRGNRERERHAAQHGAPAVARHLRNPSKTRHCEERGDERAPANHVIAIPIGHKGAQRRSNLFVLETQHKDCFALLAMTVGFEVSRHSASRTSALREIPLRGNTSPHLDGWAR